MPEDLLIEKKIELLVSMQTKSLKNDVDELRKVVVALNDEVVSIKNQVKSSVPKEELEIEAPKVEVKTEVQQEVPVKAVENHARTGDLQPGDVDIKDYFYCGNK